MKIFRIKFKNVYEYEGFIEVESEALAIKWFAENSPVGARIISIAEGNKGDLIDIKEMFN